MSDTNLRALRKSRNYTQQMVADHLGCSTAVYSRYETGLRQPSIEVLLMLADYFGVTVDYLLGRKDLELSALSSYEQELVRAARFSDDRARADALTLLQKYSVPME